MHEDQFKEILSKHNRVAIVGGPSTGKTTLARTVTDRPVFHNDAGKHIPWEMQPHHWINETEGHGSFVIEGVQAARAIRKGLEVDAVVELSDPHVELSKGQLAMHKGHKKIFGDVMDQNPYLPVYR